MVFLFYPIPAGISSSTHFSSKSNLVCLKKLTLQSDCFRRVEVRKLKKEGDKKR
jgi:hypothetical protein